MLNVDVLSSGPTGWWTVTVRGRAPGGTVKTLDVTRFREVYTVIQSVMSTEPYGPAEATLSFPTVSVLEPLGSAGSDLWWLTDGTHVTITWEPTADVLDVITRVVPVDLIGTNEKYEWQGQIVSIDGSSDRNGVTVQCQGAMLRLDNYLAQPMVAPRPTPIELAIARAFRTANDRHPTRLQKLDVRMDPSTSRRFRSSAWAKGPYDRRRGKKNWYMKPRGLENGELWSGLTTRVLGGFNRTLTEYVDPLLRSMRTDFGMYTIRLFPGRKPVLMHRSTVFSLSDPSIIVVDCASPGVVVSVGYDYTQTLTTVYGKTDSYLSGTSFDGAVFDPSGRSYWYKPFSNSYWVDPDRTVISDIGYDPFNVELRKTRDKWAVRREVYDEFPRGMTVEESREVARRHLGVTGDTGVVGSLSLENTDASVVVTEGSTSRLEPFPRQMILPGSLLRLDGLGGAKPGPVVMATEVSQEPEAGSTSVQFDSKFRDYVSVREVRLRERDALRPSHTMVMPSNFQLNIEDPLIPWSYAKGCGYFPFRSRKMWEKYFGGDAGRDFDEFGFPDAWEKMTQAFPPRLYEKYYSKIEKSPRPGRGTLEDPMNPRFFWNAPHLALKKNNEKNYNLLLSQKGTIQRTEIMCVDKWGNIEPVSFHVSVFRYQVSCGDTPRLPTTVEGPPANVVEQVEWTDSETGKDRKRVVYRGGQGRWYKKGSPYPFYRQAWDAVDAKGRTRPNVPQMEGLYIAWGNYTEKAGYWPGSSRTGGEPTGLFVDSTDWPYDQSRNDGFRYMDDYTGSRKKVAEKEQAVATAYCLIFCDDAPKKDLYFLGRFYRKMEGG